MKTIGTILLIASIFTAVSASARTREAARARLAETCYNEVAVQISIQLAFAAHEEPAGSRAEAKAEAIKNRFIDEHESYVAFKTGCNEEYDGEERFQCYTEGYVRETKRIVKKYDAANVPAYIEACSVLK